MPTSVSLPPTTTTETTTSTTESKESTSKKTSKVKKYDEKAKDYRRNYYHNVEKPKLQAKKLGPSHGVHTSDPSESEDVILPGGIPSDWLDPPALPNFDLSDLANAFSNRPPVPPPRIAAPDYGLGTENLRSHFDSFEERTKTILDNQSTRIDNVRNAIGDLHEDIRSVKRKMDAQIDPARIYEEHFARAQASIERSIHDIVHRSVTQRLDRIMDILPNTGPDFFLNMMDQIGRRFQGMPTMQPPQPPSNVFPSASQFMMPSSVTSHALSSSAGTSHIPRKPGRLHGSSTGSKLDESVLEDDEGFREEDRRRKKRERSHEESTGESDTSPPSKAGRPKKADDSGTGGRTHRERR